MSWETILKRGWSGKNLPMLKEGVEELYNSIPVGTIFKSKNMFEQFVEIISPKIGPRPQDKRMWSVWSKGKGKSWFTNYFTNYGLNRNYIERYGSRDDAKLMRV